MSDFEELLLKKALQNRRIYLWGDVCDTQAAAVIDQLYLHYEKDKTIPVHIVINSEGGSATSCEAMIDEINVLKSKGLVISTMVQGIAASAAGILLAMGTKGHRFARPSSTVMLHPMSFSLGQDYADQQKKMTIYLEKQTARINLITANSLNKDVKKYIKETKDGLWMTAEEAKKHGVIDEVNVEPLPVYPEYSYE